MGNYCSRIRLLELDYALVADNHMLFEKQFLLCYWALVEMEHLTQRYQMTCLIAQSELVTKLSHMKICSISPKS